MKFKSSVYTQVSGSVGGLTYAHNRGGMYTRARAIPSDPGSPQQLAVRNAVAILTSRWGQELTSDQRDAWNSYAEGTMIPDALGDPRKASGIAHYVRSNSLRIQCGLSVVDNGPTTLGLPSLTAPGITSVTHGTNIAIVTFANTDAWAGEVGGALLVFGSRPIGVSVNFFKGPYRYAGRINGAVSPPVSPQNVTWPFVVAVGQKVFAQFRCILADGRVSSTFRTFKVCV